MPITASLVELISALQVSDERVLLLGDHTTTQSNIQCCGVCVDSRELQSGELFVARKGATRDSHELLPQVVTQAAVCLVEESWFSGPARIELVRTSQAKRCALLAVDDTTRALGKLANWWRKKLNLKTVAITGSNGKTSAKSLLCSLLGQLVGPGTSNVKSFNNHVGLPLTILASSPSDHWLVLEAGMNHEGELDYLGSIAEPDVGVILNIGPAHIEHFGTLAKIADAKCELISRIKSSGVAVINGDDAELAGGIDRLKSHPSLRRFGIGASSAEPSLSELSVSARNLSGLGLEGTEFELVIAGKSRKTKIPHVGKHHVLNALAGVCAASALFPELTLEQFVGALPQVSRADWRFQWEQVGATVLINDAYNANPESMRGAIETVSTLAAGKRLALVIGEMLELGDKADHYHRLAGTQAGKTGASLVISLGEHASEVVQGALDAGAAAALAAASPGEVGELIAQYGPFDFVLVKGSRGMQLERVVDVLRGKLS